MAYLVLARKYRPQGFDTFVGQNVISETLKNAIKQDRVAHAYLFCGPRGVGKTSMARVFAKALNCEKGPTPEPCGKCERCKSIATGQDVDVIEIDGASNRGIDEVRDIRQNARYAASRSRYKIYYIDEVHMLTEQAFNALLKTLEEPPPHVKFIFATTAAAKLPETILSRIQRFDFRRISSSDIAKKLAEICKDEKIKMPADVLALVSRRARGSMRDSLSLLDQVISFCGDAPDLDAVSSMLGTLGDEELAGLFAKIKSGDSAGLLTATNDLIARGMDVGELLDQLMEYTRDLLVARLCGANADLLDRPKEMAQNIASAAKEFTQEHLLYISELLNTARRRVKEGQDDRIVLEMALLKLAQSPSLTPVSELIERLEALEEGGEPAPAPRPAPAPVQRAAPAKQPVEESPYRRPPPADFDDEAPPDEEPPRIGEPAPPPSGLDETWQRLLNAVRDSAGSFLYMQLSSGKLQKIQGNEAMVVFPADRKSAQREVDSTENKRTIQTALSKIVGRQVALRIVAADEPQTLSQPKAAPAKENRDADPLIQDALKKLGGRIIS